MKSKKLFFLFFVLIGFALVGTSVAGVSSPDVVIAEGGHGKPITLNNFDDVEGIGYVMQEYFLSGEAQAFKSKSLLLSRDGKWNDISRKEHREAYRVRAVVYTPKDPQRFSGTVYVEWQNVSGLIEAAPDWIHGHVEVSRQGAAYVLASVQKMGTISLKTDDPWWLPETDETVSDAVRYQSLHHPGDKYALDLFSQLAQAIRDGKLLGELKPQYLIAVGESQSAGWLTSYLNGVQALDQVYDGFLIHSSFGFTPGIFGASFADIRDDLVPVILFQAETDVRLTNGRTRQKETPEGKFRLWEVAGTAHYDAYGLVAGTRDTGKGEGEAMAFNYFKEPVTQAVEVMRCETGINSGAMHWVFNAALHWMDRWVREATPPPIAPRLEADKGWLFMSMKQDEHGNTLGGIRSPFVDAPLATLTGSGNGRAAGAPLISMFCSLFGETIPFSEQKLQTLYPTQQAFVEQFQQATFRAVESGFLLPSDAELLIQAAKNHQVVTY